LLQIFKYFSNEHNIVIFKLNYLKLNNSLLLFIFIKKCIKQLNEGETVSKVLL